MSFAEPVVEKTRLDYAIESLYEGYVGIMSVVIGADSGNPAGYAAAAIGGALIADAVHRVAFESSIVTGARKVGRFLREHLGEFENTLMA